MRVWKGLRTGFVSSLVLSSTFGATAAPQQSVFRSDAVLVPVDVRVLDNRGKPVTDLTSSDFVIAEGGVQQHVSLFANYSQQDRAASGSTRALHTGAPADGRTFVMLLGRGRLNGPSRGLHALRNFTQSELSARDRVAVVAYDRITELTMDRATVLRFIDVYAEAHETIDAKLAHLFSGLAGAFGGPTPPAGIQQAIDRIFNAPGIPRSAYLKDVANASDSTESARWFDVGLRLQHDDSIDGLVYRAELLRDVDRLRALLEYLRTLPGEKHLITLAEDGLTLGGVDLVERLAMVAADARVSVWPIQVGGLQVAHHPAQTSFEGLSWMQWWKNADSRTLADFTGGRASHYDYAAEALKVLETTTRNGYLLGYYPPRLSASDKPRRIDVRVTRRHVNVLHRRGYFVRPSASRMFHAEVRRDSQIANALAFGVTVDDIPLRLVATMGEKRSGQETVIVQITTDASKLRFAEKAGRRSTSLEVAIVVMDAAGRGIGETRKRVDLNLLPSTSQQIMRNGVALSASVGANGRATSVKAVVYDVTQERLGSVLAPVSR